MFILGSPWFRHSERPTFYTLTYFRPKIRGSLNKSDFGQIKLHGLVSGLPLLAHHEVEKLEW